MTADAEFRDHTIEKVEGPGGGWWTVTDSEGWSIGVPEKDGIVPRVGSSIRFYGQGIGFPVRGISIDGRAVYYRTPAEEEAKRIEDVAESERLQRAKFARDIAKHDATYAALPPELRRRIDGFRATSPDWRWRFEAYEAFACAEAVKIATACETVERAREFARLDWPKQRKRVPALDDGHSGNTFGFACRLAHWLLSTPATVEVEHGALCPLVGCAQYGCPPARNS